MVFGKCTRISFHGYVYATPLPKVIFVWVFFFFFFFHIYVHLQNSGKQKPCKNFYLFSNQVMILLILMDLSVTGSGPFWPLVLRNRGPSNIYPGHICICNIPLQRLKSSAKIYKVLVGPLVIKFCGPLRIFESNWLEGLLYFNHWLYFDHH